MKYKLVLIGNPPSSGSTFFGDLIDSTPFSACGPELNLFSLRKFYDKFRHKNKIKSISSLSEVSPSLYSIKNRPYLFNLSAYGLDESILVRMINSSSSFLEFVNFFGYWYVALRTRSDCPLIFEKTPQNIYAIQDFLEIYRNGYFVIIVRNPIFIFYSLLRRGFTPFQALFTPLIDLSVLFSLRKDLKERLVLVKYEDLVKDPFWEIQKILSAIAGIQFSDKDDFETRFEKNIYRIVHDRRRSEFFNKAWLKSWTETQVGVVTNANKRAIPDSVLEMFKWGIRFAVNPNYAKLFGNISTISYFKLLEYLGYKDEILTRLNDVKKIKPISYTKKDIIFLLSKLAFIQKKINLSFFNIFALMRPIIPSEEYRHG